MVNTEILHGQGKISFSTEDCSRRKESENSQRERSRFPINREGPVAVITIFYVVDNLVRIPIVC